MQVIKGGNFKVLLGAAFLMATSAVGPGFMTQTAVFTQKYGSDFGFVILISIILSFIAQLNIWRIITVSNLRGQDIANKVLPGLGYVVAFLVALGGLAFNIGNVGGAALGLNTIFDLNISVAAGIAGIFGIVIFISKKASSAMDLIAKVFGLIMIVLIAFVAFKTNPPVVQAIKHTFLPTQIPLLSIITLVGGTVGGYITFSGGHRLLDAGISGVGSLKDVNKSAGVGILVDLCIRVLLFLAILGVVSAGFILDEKNPAGDAFKIATGDIGNILFGIVFFCAAMTSVVGAAYTSVSFLKTLFKGINKYENLWIIIFIAVSTLILIFIGKPAKLLVLAGALNGLILPITLCVMLYACTKKQIVGEYVHAKWLFYSGWIVVIITAILGLMSLQPILGLLK